MANVKLGIILTEIVGSVGGGTFRRSPAGLVLQTFNRGRSRSKIAQNTQLAKMGSFVAGWSVLAQIEKDKWDAMALVYQFPDKFGDMRHLTGRQLYLKLQGNFLVINGPVIDILNSDTIRPSFELDTIALNPNNPLVLTLKNNDSFGYCLLQIVRRTKGQKAVNWARSAFMAFIDLSVSNSVDFSQVFHERYPYAVDGDNLVFFLTAMNDYGFRSNAIAKDEVFEIPPPPYYFKIPVTPVVYMVGNNRILTPPFSLEIEYKIPTPVNVTPIFGGSKGNTQLDNAGQMYWRQAPEPPIVVPAGIIAYNLKSTFRVESDGIQTRFYKNGILFFTKNESFETYLKYVFLKGVGVDDAELFKMSINDIPYIFTALVNDKVFDINGNEMKIISGLPMNQVWLPVP